MKLLILFGPPAVGKTTIGKAIEEKTDFKLFHNHMVMDGVMQLFGVGTAVEDKLSKEFRTRIIEEAADSGLDLIFTYVWNFGKEKGKNNIDTYKEIYESKGGEVLFVELTAPLETRIERGDHVDRCKNKYNAPDGNRVKWLEENMNFQSPDPFYYPDKYIKVSSENADPTEAANKIIEFLNKN